MRPSGESSSAAQADLQAAVESADSRPNSRADGEENREEDCHSHRSGSIFYFFYEFTGNSSVELVSLQCDTGGEDGRRAGSRRALA